MGTFRKKLGNLAKAMGKSKGVSFPVTRAVRKLAKGVSDTTCSTGGSDGEDDGRHGIEA